MERSGRRADRNQTLSRQLRSLVPALSYCPDAEPPLNVSGDLLSAEYATGHRVFVCLLAFRSGGAINTTQLMCSRSEGCSGFHLSQPPWASWAPSRQTKWNKDCFFFFYLSKRPYLASSSIWKELLSVAPGPGGEAEPNRYRWKQWVHLKVSKALHTYYITGTIKDFIWDWAGRAAGVQRPYKCRRPKWRSRAGRTEGRGTEQLQIKLRRTVS